MGQGDWKRPRDPSLDPDSVVYDIYQMGGDGRWTYEFHLTEEQREAIFMVWGMSKVYTFSTYKSRSKEKVERKAQRLAERVIECVCAHRQRKEIEARRDRHTVEVKCS